jgi:acyl-CoA dehydrogenase
LQARTVDLVYPFTRGPQRNAKSLGFSASMDNIKLSSSTLVLDILQRALGICGLDGYKNTSETSLARMLRDANAAPLMVNNDRTLQASAHALLLRKEI